ncbi:MAG: hypothetical protein IJL20_07965 [Lachnospiraceae bacterium]|nr:hypothetical protein [Lachnospiraceae bacterium]
MKRKAMITSVLMAFLFIVLTLPKAVYGADAPALGPLKAGEYMEHIEGYEFPLCSAKDYEIEYDRFILKVEAGVYIDESFPAIIDEIMGIIEEKTKLSFMPKSSPVNYEGKKPIIDIEKRHTYGEYGAAIESASHIGVSFYEDEAVSGRITDEFNTIIHELLHVIQLRNFGYVGDILTEGYAESYAGTIETLLSKKYADRVRYSERQNEISNIAAYGINECGLDVDYDINWVTEDNIKKYFFLEPGHSGHEPSYWIVEYIREKYGDDGLKKVLEADKKEYSKHSSDLGYKIPNKTELAIIEKNLSKSFVKDFYKWFKAQFNEESFYSSKTDYTDTKQVKGLLGIICNYEGKTTLEAVCDIKYKDSLTVDYTEAFAYCQQVLGREIKGIGGTFYGTGKLSFYDAHDRLIYETGDKNTFFNAEIYVPHAVKYVITGSGTNDFSHYENSEKDAFSDASYTNINSGIGAVKDNSTVSGKPASIKVKSEKALASALKKCKSTGGTITITKSFTINDPLVIYPGTEVKIKKGKKLTLKARLTILGTLTNSAKAVKMSGGCIVVKDASWKNGSTTYKVSSSDKTSGRSSALMINDKNKVFGGYGSKITLETDQKEAKELQASLLLDNYDTLKLNGKKISAGGSGGKSEKDSDGNDIYTVTSADEFYSVLSRSVGTGIKVTVTKNITLKDTDKYYPVPAGVELIIKSGVTLTLNEDISLDISGSLTGDAGSLILKSGSWMWMNENAVVTLGDVTYKTKVRDEFYNESRNCSCGFRFDPVSGSNSKYKVYYGLYNRLYVTAPSGHKASEYINVLTAELREGAMVYFNKKKIS